MKDEILKKAIDLFLNYGFKSVTMDDIANELGISKKTIYSHYSTKLKLIEATTFHVFEKINSGICTICSKNHNPIEEIYMIKSLVMDQLKDEKTSPQYQLQKYYPKIFEILKQKQFESVNECISSNLQQGIEQGYYHHELDVNFITRLYFNGLMGIKNLELFPTDDFSSTYLMDSFLEYHLRAISTKKGLKKLNEMKKK